MRKLVLLIAIAILSFAQFSQAQKALPQLQAGTYVYDSVIVLNMTFMGNCNPSAEYTISLSPSMIPVATGVNAQLLISALNEPFESITNNITGIVHINDVFNFSLSYSSFSFYSTAGGTMIAKLIITGTPTVPNQKYFCNISSSGGEQCPIFINWNGMDTCTVLAASSVAEINNSSTINVYNNPASNSIHVQYESTSVQTVTFHLFNLLGQEVLSTSFHDKTKALELPAGKLCSGLYIWEIIGTDGVRRTGKLIK